MAIAEIGTLPMWYDRRGSGDPLVMLHPGGPGVDSRALMPNVTGLAPLFRVYTPEQRGHGRTPDVPGPYSFELMARDTARFIDRVVGEPVHLFGCGDGAVIALTVALREPSLVRRLVLTAGVFHHDGWVPGGPPPEFLRLSYAELSPDGARHFDIVAGKLAAMYRTEPAFSPADLETVRCRTLVMVADDDEVRLEHAIEMYRSLAHAELAVVPGTSHGLLVEKPYLCNALIADFLTKEPVELVRFA